MIYNINEIDGKYYLSKNNMCISNVLYDKIVFDGYNYIMYLLDRCHIYNIYSDQMIEVNEYISGFDYDLVLLKNNNKYGVYSFLKKDMVLGYRYDYIGKIGLNIYKCVDEDDLYIYNKKMDRVLYIDKNSNVDKMYFMKDSNDIIVKYIDNTYNIVSNRYCKILFNSVYTYVYGYKDGYMILGDNERYIIYDYNYNVVKLSDFIKKKSVYRIDDVYYFLISSDLLLQEDKEYIINICCNSVGKYTYLVMVLFGDIRIDKKLDLWFSKFKVIDVCNMNEIEWDNSILYPYQIEEI